MLIEILNKNVCVLQRSTIGKDINTLSIDNFFIFLAKAHKPAFRKQGAKDLLSLVYFSLKMEKVGFLCGLAPLRD